MQCSAFNFHSEVRYSTHLLWLHLTSVIYVIHKGWQMEIMLLLQVTNTKYTNTKEVHVKCLSATKKYMQPEATR